MRLHAVDNAPADLAELFIRQRMIHCADFKTIRNALLAFFERSARILPHEFNADQRFSRQACEFILDHCDRLPQIRDH